MKTAAIPMVLFNLVSVILTSLVVVHTAFVHYIACGFHVLSPVYTIHIAFLNDA